MGSKSCVDDPCPISRSRSYDQDLDRQKVSDRPATPLQPAPSENQSPAGPRDSVKLLTYGRRSTTRIYRLATRNITTAAQLGE